MTVPGHLAVGLQDETADRGGAGNRESCEVLRRKVERRIAEWTHPFADGFQKPRIVASEIETAVAVFVVKHLGKHY
jgi:hypothetical protein